MRVSGVRLCLLNSTECQWDKEVGAVGKTEVKVLEHGV